MKKHFSLLIISSIFASYMSFAANFFLVDEFASNTLDKNLKIQKSQYVPIVDDFANNTLDKSLKINKSIPVKIEDSLALKINSKDIKFNYYDKNQKFDFSKASVQIARVRPLKYYTTRKNLKEGQYIDFELTQDVNINNVVYKRGTSVKARVENISPNLAYGVPADLVVDNFVLANKIQLSGQIEKRGANRAIWIYPVAYTTSIFFGLGLSFFFFQFLLW